MVKVTPWALSAAPFMVLAQTGLLQGNTSFVERLAGAAGDILQWLVVIFIALAVVFFLRGLLNFMRKEGAERADAKKDMLWGIIIIAVMVSVWGLVEFLQDLVGVDSNVTPQTPSIPVVQ
jgi:succinate dehydrogenase/fumarate reductase cytochrome b subunit